MGGGRRRPPGKLDWRRVGLGGLVVLTFCVVAATITAAALVWYGERQISQVDVETQVPGDTDGDGAVDIQELTDLRNVLVVGSDSRDDMTRQERRELGVGSFEGTRTDTIMLVQLDPERHGAAILSFPRDLLVQRCDGTQGRINGAFEIGMTSGVGGPTCLVRTITDLTGIPIHHYVQVNFQGFVEVVDRLGGVRMYIDQPIQDDEAHIDLQPGCVTLRGKEALGFVRVRKIDNDFGRIARQQRFIREMVDQVTSASVALNVPRLFSLVEAGAQAVETDPALSLNVMRQIAFSFRDLSSDNIDSRTVPGFNRLISGVAYVVADEEPAEALFAAFRAGVAAPSELGRKGPGDVKIGDVPPVTVLNGTGVAGLAGDAAEALRKQGYEVAGVGNDDRRLTTTRVVYSGSRREEAELVRELFPGATIVRDADADGVVVRLGEDTDRDLLLATEEVEPTGAPEPREEPTFAGASADRDC